MIKINGIEYIEVVGIIDSDNKKIYTILEIIEKINSKKINSFIDKDIVHLIAKDFDDPLNSLEKHYVKFLYSSALDQIIDSSKVMARFRINDEKEITAEQLLKIVNLFIERKKEYDIQESVILLNQLNFDLSLFEINTKKIVENGLNKEFISYDFKTKKNQTLIKNKAASLIKDYKFTTLLEQDLYNILFIFIYNNFRLKDLLNINDHQKIKNILVDKDNIELLSDDEISNYVDYLLTLKTKPND